ncbi:MAG: TonB-dependent receptor [Chlorobi bacterium]|nr:TonB-dependent receptor [Chlorobiota bacterium]
MRVAGWILAVALMMFSIANAQQQCHLTIMVKDAETKKPVSEAIILINGKQSGTTDAKGLWQKELPCKNISITVQHLNFEIATQNIQLSESKQEIIIWLKPRTYRLPTVPIDVRPEFDQMERLEPTHLPVLPTPVPSVEKSIGILPGVASSNELSSQYNVRGGNYDENLVFINGFEIYRPQLVRSAQYEGLSAINPDLVQAIRFSAGGFPAQYGGKMSSVLDVDYVQPDSLQFRVRMSLLGVSASTFYNSKDYRLNFVSSARYSSYSYLLKTLPQKGVYKPVFLDFQTAGTYQFSERTYLDFLAYGSLARFKFYPQNEVVKFGTVNRVLQFTAYMQGAEINGFDIGIVGTRIRHKTQKDAELSLQMQYSRILEIQKEDVASAYWLGQVQTDPQKEDYGQVIYALGAGEFHIWRRNYALFNIVQAEGSYEQKNQQLGLGMKSWTVSDFIYEWERLDSAGYSLPRSDTAVLMHKFTEGQGYQPLYAMWAYFTKNVSFEKLTLIAGLRMTYWLPAREILPEPRLSIKFPAFKNWDLNIATGLFYQLPFYREFITQTGDYKWQSVKSQKSIHLIGTASRTVKIAQKDFLYQSSLYGKYLWDVNIYDIYGVFIDYWANNDATAYVVGWEHRLNGSLLPGTESWISLTFLHTQEKIGDRWVERPSDEHFRVSMLILDRVPQVPNLRFTMLAHFASGIPFSPPPETTYALQYRNTFRMPPYLRIDMGLRLVLVDKEDPEGTSAIHNPALSFFDKLWIDLQIFNILDRRNVFSYYWIRDISGIYYAIPRRLTGRLFNLSIYASF